MARLGRMKDFGTKNKGGKKDLPTQLGTNKTAKKLIHRKKPTQY